MTGRMRRVPFIAVFHDVLMVLAFFSVFQWEINLTVIAAILTIVGFSVNDSIVIFDRVRENLQINRTDSLFKITNDSINQTLSRTIITSGLVLLSVLALVLFGGEVLRSFSLALLVGVVLGHTRPWLSRARSLSGGRTNSATLRVKDALLRKSSREKLASVVAAVRDDIAATGDALAYSLVSMFCKSKRCETTVLFLTLRSEAFRLHTVAGQLNVLFVFFRVLTFAERSGIRGTFACSTGKVRRSHLTTLQ